MHEDAQLMEQALRQAEAAVASGQTPFGAVVVGADGAVIGEGHNNVRAERDPTAHGEIVAIRNAWQRLGGWEKLKGATIYTSCEPCLLCCFVIVQLAFRRVVFAARGTDVPGSPPFLGIGLIDVAAWVNAQPETASLEVVADFMRQRALEAIQAFQWDGIIGSNARD